ncbi:hypothetical protein BAE44_0008172 [Dichanthelium oligosanthes]|uniref:F-box domain-containing protein n=1 Tax=Dichanthelium oligosanthes TaxID=888268 RepID=A0A1E5W089_9POAL|nr:hypothetical protein BAE44_0008172 [Dichanthelium oligosanthes]
MAAKRCADLLASSQSQKKISRSVAEPRPAGLPLPCITDGLIFEILVRLPAKSVTRFKCVCKAWLAMISSRHFVDAHLELCKLRPTMLIVPGEYSYHPEREGKTAFWMGFYKFEVLTLGTNVWRRTVDPPYPIILGVTPAHVRGFIYWRVDLPLEMDPKVLVRFSLANETFSLIPYPPGAAPPVGFMELDSVLCCACFTKPCEVVEIWACNSTDVPTWTRLCTVLLPQETIVPVPGGLFRSPKVVFHGKDLLIIGGHKMYRTGTALELGE